MTVIPMPAAAIDAILKLHVPVIVRLGERRAAFDEVVHWAPGMIVELFKDSLADLDLLVNNVLVGHGVAVKVGENFGLQITCVGDLKAKIAAMSAKVGGDPRLAGASAEDQAARLASQFLGPESAAKPGATPPPSSAAPSAKPAATAGSASTGATPQAAAATSDKKSK